VPGAEECGVRTSCYVDATIATINAITRDIDFWSQVQIATLIATVVFGVLATVMIALQGDDNRYWTRPVGIIATALVTGIASLTTALHVPDNIDKLIDIRRQFTSLVNNFEYDIQRKRAWRPTKFARNSPTNTASSTASASSSKVRLAA
jgi:hypothetical protein